ncbi:CaiB/BaiF CoA-transferase family protein [Parafrankia sp. EUN1f]|uniref:CaiB/BaiF CoA transferase family protein n=1 Tax=Parafrankia sp. EUN1f TaxID=102897 RepID=UPI0001C44747|nr:CoA transferase [Parafrankia sp. EUN1f]EFC82908.1 L-carnitine dehydratase/bile acid-inducible protein F [Parafrankia sp. EUN1f]
MNGPLDRLRVLEIAGEFSAYPSKLLADLGADVIVVEPPHGAATRSWGPFADDRPGPEASLYWRHYNTSKRGIVLDLTEDAGRERLHHLLAKCDVLIEGMPGSEAAAALRLDPGTFTATFPSLVWVSVTPFGRRGAPPDVPTTDLTLLAGGGPVLTCGYDDHTLPPVRGGGNQSVHVGGMFAVTATLTALLNRTVSGRGQHVDVSIDAALNVSCETATTHQLTDGGVVRRQTGRHAMVEPTAPTQVRAADGDYVVLGFPPRAAEDYASILEWIDLVGIRDDFPDAVLLEMGVERGGVGVVELGTDPIAQQIWNAARDAMVLLAERTPAYEYFLGCQRRGLVAGFVAAPEAVIHDPHLVARDFATKVTDPHTGREETHPGAPYRFTRTPWRISRPAPRLGEHTDAVLGGPG